MLGASCSCCIIALASTSSMAEHTSSYQERSQRVNLNMVASLVAASKQFCRALLSLLSLNRKLQYEYSSLSALFLDR
jgi:hypothetical protein